MTNHCFDSPIVVLTGPTGSGKSDISLSLCGELNSEIVSIDSAQVYEGCDIGTAKPSAEIRSKVAHHLIDVCKPDTQYDIGRFVHDADRSISEILGRRALPLIVGGTTMYLTGLLNGLMEAPRRNESLRNSLLSCSSEELHARLKNVDPESALRIAPQDKQRLARALEVHELTNLTFEEHRQIHAHKEKRYPAIVIILCAKRDLLYSRINTRVRAMLNQGLLAEVSALRAKYGDNAAALRSIGYAQTLSVLQGKEPEAKLEEAIAMATRRYAKRQMTYFRNEPRKRSWLEIEQARQFRRVRIGDEGRGATAGFDACEMTLSDLISTIKYWLSSKPAGIGYCYVDVSCLCK